MAHPEWFSKVRPRRDFIEKTLIRLSTALDYAARAEDSGAGGGFLQQVDPRVKLAGALLLILAVVASQRVIVIVGIFAAGLIAARASGALVLRAIASLWGGILLFTGAIVLPAIFTTPGTVVFQLPWLAWTATDHGLRSAITLIARAETTATLAALMVLTTRWAHLLKALRILRMPAVFVVILGMTHRFVFVLLQIARDFFEARRARVIGNLDGRQRRQIAAASAGALVSKSVQLSSEVFEAMQARGFRGNVFTLDEFRMKRLDWCVSAAVVILATAAFWMGSL